MNTPVEEGVDEYLRHLEEFYDQIREWLRAEGLTWEEKKVDVIDVPVRCEY